MLPTKSGRSYSDFFTSGFRAMMTQSSRRRFTMPPPTTHENDLPFQPMSSPSSSRRHSKLVDFAKRHSRPTSMILSRSTSSQMQTTSSSLSTPSRERHKRRSSIINFSSRLFDRKGSAILDNSLSFSSSPSKNSCELLDSMVWITTGGPYTLKSYEDSIMSIDPFASSPDSKSFFSDWTESPAPSNRSSRGQRESFLSLSGGSSSDRSFLRLPNIRRRERPTSVQTAPLPAKSRRSSYIAFPSTRRDSWIHGEEVMEERDINFFWQGTGRFVEDIVEEHPALDPAQNIDWRQFHLDVLPHEA